MIYSKKVPQNPFEVIEKNGELLLDSKFAIHYSPKPYLKFLTYCKSGLRIAKTAIDNEKLLQGSESDIIKQIHAIRYTASNPYVTTGGHFLQIFVRNMGIFFNALLDPRIPCSKKDWRDRQAIALKTIAHDLEVFSLAGKDFTTITKVHSNLYTGLNIYARPSDSLFAILYTLQALQDDTFIARISPTRSPAQHRLQTKTTAQKLLKTYASSLEELVARYYEEVFDTHTQLIKKTLLLSSARDGIKRQSSFYDNVILWSTIKLAQSLQLYKITPKELAAWRTHIIDTFWDDTQGIFVNDLSQESMSEKTFSADSFIITSTQFLHFGNLKDRKKLQRMVSFVKKNKLDMPFPLHYSSQDQPQKLYLPVRYFAPPYMGTSIWCHWGMEYIKTLCLLSRWDSQLLTDAKAHMKTYKRNIERYGGYPEVYDKNGTILRTRLYRSVLHNGWIINYEQTRMLLNDLQ